MKIDLVSDITCAVGEGPWWDVAEQALFLVDMRGQRVWRFHPESGATEHWEMPRHTGLVTLAKDGRLVIVLSDGIFTLDRKDGAFQTLLMPDLPENTQFSDGKTDRHGRLIVATVDKQMKDPLGSVFSYDRGAFREHDRGFALSNGPCFSPDDRSFYCADSRASTVYVYDYDLESGDMGPRRLFADTSPFGGLADGATVDSEGRLWMAMCAVGKVIAFAPDGTVERVIDMPTAGVSSVMFGGPDLDRLFVTSLDVSLFGKPASPNAGRLFVIDGLGVQGLPERRVEL